MEAPVPLPHRGHKVCEANNRFCGASESRVSRSGTSAKVRNGWLLLHERSDHVFPQSDQEARAGLHPPIRYGKHLHVVLHDHSRKAARAPRTG